MLDEAGLGATLRWYVDRQLGSGSVDVELSLPADGHDVPPGLRSPCFRVVQEALTNVVRHAKARHVKVEVRTDISGTELSVEDDGTGFDVEEARLRAGTGRSFGLLGMQERVELRGGQFQLESAPGIGTRLVARFPARVACEVRVSA